MFKLYDPVELDVSRADCLRNLRNTEARMRRCVGFASSKADVMVRLKAQNAAQNEHCWITDGSGVAGGVEGLLKSEHLQL